MKMARKFHGETRIYPVRFPHYALPGRCEALEMLMAFEGDSWGISGVRNCGAGIGAPA